MIRQQITKSFKTTPFHGLTHLTSSFGALKYPIIPKNILFRGFCLDIRNVPRDKVRNVAIIAHVDHGKTSLVDCLLKDSGFSVEPNSRVMDNIDLEKEKGITIMSKATGIPFNGHFINLVDTPGHQDFGGEVERIMSIVDGVVLVVCSTEGPMAQTKFVLKKAIEANIKPIVVVNKVDRESSRVSEVEEEIFETFLELDENESFLDDYTVFYASAKSGYAIPAGGVIPKSGEGDTTCILEGIIKHIPSPVIDDSIKFGSFLVSQVEHSHYFGKMLRGRLETGLLKVGDEVDSYDQQGNLIESGGIVKIFKNVNMEMIEVLETHPGEIYSICGLNMTEITHTICSKGEKRVIKSKILDPPMINVIVTPNSSPKAGIESEKQNSLSVLAKRFQKESELDAALEVELIGNSIIVKGRGDLHIGVLLEKLRREGYELECTSPTVITREVDGVEVESVERVNIEAQDKHAAMILDRIMHRQGDIVSMDVLENGNQKIVAELFTRALFGFRLEVMTLSSNTALYDSEIVRWEEAPEFETKERSVIVSTEDGNAKAYALKDFEKLGNLFVTHNTPVYAGMIVGESASDREWNVNPCKEKKLTNVRASGKDEAIKLVPARLFKVEEAISYIQEDELVEITPKSVRLRKKELNQKARRAAKRK